MKINYIKPALMAGREPVTLIPLIGLVVGMPFLAASAPAAVGGLAAGAALGGLAAGTALAKKAGHDYCRLGQLPALDGVESYA
jgi:hypothetical protein